MINEWTKTTLGECCDVVSGATPRTDVPEFWNGPIIWVTPKDLSENKKKYIADSPRKISQEGLDSCAASILPAYSVLFSSRAPIGHVAINTVPVATNQGFKSLVPNRTKLLPDYLYYWLKAHRKYLESLGNGATFKEVSKNIVSRIEIKLPPLDAQHRIAGILDRADVIRSKRTETLSKLNELRQSIFLEMFGDPATNPKGFMMGTIRDLVAEAKYGTAAKASDSVGQFKILRMNNITYSGDLDLTDMKYIDLQEDEEDKYMVREGDILFNRTNSKELVGKTAVFHGDEPMAIAGYLVRIRTNGKAHPEFVSALLNSKYGKLTLNNMCKSIVGMANINAQEVQNIRTYLPPIELQSEFAARIRKVLELKSSLADSDRKFKELFHSLEQRAFQGELTL